MTLRKPAWPPSLKLTSQHLEAREEFLEDLLTHRVAQVSHGDHGLVEVVMDDESLAGGEVVITKLVVVFRNGALATHEGELRFALTSALGDIGTTVDLFVEWPSRSFDGSSVVDEIAATTARWRRVDETTPAGTMSTLAPALRLTAGSAGDHGERLLIGRFVRGANGVGFVDDVVPPLLALRAFAPLSSAAGRAAGAVSARVAELLAARANTPLEPTRFALSQAPALHLLSLLQRYFVRLEDMQARRLVHPREFYEVLVTLVGELSAVAEGRPEPMPAYDHDAPGGAMRELIERLEYLLARSARENVMAFPFKRIDDTTYRARLRPEAFIGRRPFLVASGLDEQTLRDKVPALAKIASGAAINQLLQSSVRGVNIAVEFDPPAELPTRRSFVCYRLDVRDRYWSDIRERLDMVVHLPIQSKTLELTLYAVE